MRELDREWGGGIKITPQWMRERVSSSRNDRVAHADEEIDPGNSSDAEDVPFERSLGSESLGILLDSKQGGNRPLGVWWLVGCCGSGPWNPTYPIQHDPHLVD